VSTGARTVARLKPLRKVFLEALIADYAAAQPCPAAQAVTVAGGRRPVSASAIASPITAPNLKPWPEKPASEHPRAPLPVPCKVPANFGLQGEWVGGICEGRLGVRYCLTGHLAAVSAAEGEAAEIAGKQT
jgi:hypothetical protein